MPPTAAHPKGYLGYSGPSCPKCSYAFPPGALDTRTHTCPRCSTRFEAIRYSPVEVRIEVTQLAGGPETDAPCSRHEGNSAVASCNRCGKFICALCRTEADDRIFCPSCFDRLTAGGDLASTASRLRNWLGLSFMMVLLGIIILIPIYTSILALVPAFAGIYFCTRGLREKRARDESDGIAGLTVSLVFHVLIVGAGILIAIRVFGVFS